MSLVRTHFWQEVDVEKVRYNVDQHGLIRADLLHGLLALVVLLKLIHAGVGKQQRGIVGNKGRRRIELKTALLKEVEELGADLGRSH